MTLEEAKKHLQAWLDAELKVSQGQEFSMGSRRLAMPDLPYIADRINYWEQEVKRLEGGSGRRRTFYVVPMDR
ncbi:DUF6148 family protein [Acetomicrobium sp. S15 = DSM 107314]|uniref:DUF6148 family protein n=1 Tax=Acetomicrobium sp. S15 = DSM 107314 TaxID=2529858 RepID=UPI0018E0EFEE